MAESEAHEFLGLKTEDPEDLGHERSSSSRDPPEDESQLIRTQTMEANELTQLQLGPFEAGVTCEILSAWYGVPGDDRRRIDVTHYCRNSWSATTGLTLKNYNRLFTDPAPMRVKKMVVEYRLTFSKPWDVANTRYASGASRMGLYPVIAAKVSRMGGRPMTTGFAGRNRRIYANVVMPCCGWLLLVLLACSHSLESLLPTRDAPRDHTTFVRLKTRYEDVAWEPGNVSCWNHPAAKEQDLDFRSCCYVQENQTWRLQRKARRRGEPNCWKIPGLSFRRCCSAEALWNGTVGTPPASQYAFRAVVAMTTIPPRLFDLSDVIKSLIRQSRRPDALYLSIPYFYSRSWTPYEHPWWYSFLDPMIRMVRCEQDYRSNTGILCMLQYESDPNTRILVVDDDQIYHPFLLERLLAISADIPGAMIGGLSYHQQGIQCWKHNKRGMCAVPNLVHTTYGILYQRRFFDAGIFNFDAAAKALERVYPSNGPSGDYVITSCMLEDNVWWEAHLARKGIPRVFMSTRLDSKTIAELAFGHGALTSSEDKVGYHHFHFDRQDPHSTAAALDTCTDALAALWGPSLWPARKRHVISCVDTARSRSNQVPWLMSLVSSIPWYEAREAEAPPHGGRAQGGFKNKHTLQPCPWISILKLAICLAQATFYTINTLSLSDPLPLINILVMWMWLLLFSALTSGVSAKSATNGSCLLQQRANRSLTEGDYSNYYCGSTSLDKDDGCKTDWGDIDINYVYRPSSAFDDTRPPGFTGATTSRNVFFMAVAGIGYTVDKVKVKVKCYDKNGNEYAKENSKSTDLTVGLAGVWQLPAMWYPLSGSGIHCNYRVKVKALWGQWKKKTITGANYGTDDFIVVKMTGTTQNVKLDFKKSPSHVKCRDTW
eukprot:symbB.v1.2.014311.t1/scaffold1045.1/size142133/5